MHRFDWKRAVSTPAYSLVAFQKREIGESCQEPIVPCGQRASLMFCFCFGSGISAHENKTKSSSLKLYFMSILGNERSSVKSLRLCEQEPQQRNSRGIEESCVQDV